MSASAGFTTSTVRRSIRSRGVVHPDTPSIPKQCCIRLSAETSAKLASIQGLCVRYGQRETLARLFAEVAMPAFEEYVRPYAARAKEERRAARETEGRKV